MSTSKKLILALLGTLGCVAGLALLLFRSPGEHWEAPRRELAASAGPTKVVEAPPPAVPNEPSPVPVAAEQETPARPRGGSISGRVLDGRGAPVAGASVQVDVSADNVDRSDEALARALSLSAIAAEDGRYAIEGLAPRSDYVLRATHGDFAPTAEGGIEVGEDEAVEGADLVLHRGGSIAGRVLDESGDGIARARIWARLSSQPQEGFAPPFGASEDPTRDPDAVSAADGSYRLFHLPAGGHSLRARDPDAKRLAGEVEDVEVAEEKVTEPIDILLKAGETLAGRVVDTDGKPIGGASVLTSGAAAVSSADDGSFEVTGLPPGKAHVNVSKQGYDLVIEDPAIPARDVVFTLIPIGAIAGTIRARDQAVFPELRIQVSRRGEDETEEWNVTGRDASGRFEVKGKAGTYILTARVPGFAPSRSAEIVLLARERKEGVVIELEKGCTVRGRVVARRSGEPVTGAHISVRLSAATGADRWAPVMGGDGAESGADGSFTLDGVVAGKVDLEVRHGAYTEAQLQGLEVRSGQPAEVTIELNEGGRIQGVARRGPTPMSGARIGAMRRGEHISYEALSDSTGRFEVKGLEEGEYVLRLMAKLPSGGHRTIHGELVVVKDGGTTEVDLVEPTPVTLSGRVTAGGASLDGGKIEAECLENGDDVEGVIDVAGAYSLEVEGGGQYLVTVERGGDHPGRARVRVAVPAGASEQRRDIELAGGEVSGVVVEKSGGKPVANAEVWAFPSGAPVVGSVALYRLVSSLATTDEGGRFVLPGLAPGEYSVRAFAAGHVDGQVQSVRVEDRGGPAEIRIELAAGASLEARVVDAGGKPVAEAVASLRTPAGELVLINPATSNDEGLVTLLAPAEGAYRLCVLHFEYVACLVPVEIGAAPGPIGVTLAKGGKLRVRVRDARGKPVAGAVVRVRAEESGLPGGDLVSLLGDLGMPPVTQIDGYLVIGEAPPGTYRVTAATEGSASQQVSVAVQAGKTAEVELVVGN